MQAQGKEIKDQINEKMEEQKSIREIAKQHRDREDDTEQNTRIDRQESGKRKTIESRVLCSSTG